MTNKLKTISLISAAVVAITLAGCTKEETPAVTTTAPTTPPVVEVEESSIDLDNTSYEAGDVIEATYEVFEDITDTAWIGVVPSDVVHDDEVVADESDSDYVYLTDSEGTIELDVPDEAGEYDVRIYSSDLAADEGEELASVSFTVEAGELVAKVEVIGEVDLSEIDVQLLLDKEEYEVGEDVTIDFSGAAGLDSFAWLGVIASDIEHGDEAVNDENDTDYDYLGGEDAGTVVLTAPSEAGEYDIRLNSSDSDGEELTYVSFTVVE